jgi:hypothetical protein
MSRIAARGNRVRFLSASALALALAATLAAVSASGASAFSQFRIVGAHAQYNGGATGLNNAGIVYGTAEFNHVFNVPMIWLPGAQPVTPDPNQPLDPSTFDDGFLIGADAAGNATGIDLFTDHTSYWAVADGTNYILGFGPQAMNDNDVIVGDDGNIFQLPGSPGSTGAGSTLLGVNDNNEIIGTDPSSVGAYWDWNGATLTATEHPIPLPAGSTSVAPQFINNQDDIVGATSLGQDFIYHIGDAASSYLPGTVGAIDGFSDQNTVLYHRSTSFNSYALYQPETDFTQTVHTLLPASGWVLQYVEGINSHLEIAGGGELNGAVPVPVKLVANEPLSSQPDPGVSGHGHIRYVLHLPTIPIILQWRPRPPEGDPAYLEHLQTSLNAGKTWQDVKLARRTSVSATIDATPGAAYLARAAVTDKLLQTSKWAKGATFTPALVDDADNAVSETAEWKHLADKKAVDNTISETGQNGAETTWSFTGQSFGVIARAEPGAGTATLVVDGVSVGQISFAASGLDEGRIVYAADLAPGAHTVKLLADGDGTIDLDGFAAVG